MMKPRFQSPFLVALAKFLTISGALVFFYYTFFYNIIACNKSPDLSTMPMVEVKFSNDSSKSIDNYYYYPTNISHIKFVLVGCVRTWKHRRPYAEAWWRPNETRGNIFMDIPPTKELLPWPPTVPPFRLNDDATKLPVYPKLANPIEARIFRSVLDSFRVGDNKDVRWFVVADDDTVFFVDNLVQALARYDHTKRYYVGMYSEAIISNFLFSFDMAYGGGGYAMSYSLVEELAPLMDGCLERYPLMHTSDQLSSSCLSDLGVGLTVERGFHQIDLLGDISGLLSAHPQHPIITLHHFDNIVPLFPSKTRIQSINHLMEAAKVDQSRLAQQTVGYNKKFNWSVSISWGYSVYMYETIIPRSVLRIPLETFAPWKSGPPPVYMFNTRLPTNDPCLAPHVFFMESVKKVREDGLVLASYRRKAHRGLPPCLVSGNHSADHVVRIRVYSNATMRKEPGKTECCNVKYMVGTKVINIRMRDCWKGEVIA